MAVTGPQLRAERRAAEVTTIEMAARLKTSRATVWVIERSAILTVERVAQYRAALADAIEAAAGRIA